MRVDPEDEELIRRAGKVINERVKSYQAKFGIDDKQDLLAMVAFDSTVDKMKAEGEINSTDDSVVEKVSYLNKLISQSI